MISFTVHGLPQPAGSKTPSPIWCGQPDGSRRMVTRPDGSPVLAVRDDNPKAATWRQEIVAVATRVMDGKPLLLGPIQISIQLVFPRLKSHFRAGRNAHELRPDAPHYHTTKPDRLKCCRALEDALTGIVYRDDSQICSGPVEKIYGDSAHTNVTIESLAHLNESMQAASFAMAGQ